MVILNLIPEAPFIPVYVPDNDETSALQQNLEKLWQARDQGARLYVAQQNNLINLQAKFFVSVPQNIAQTVNLCMLELSYQV